MVRLSSTHGRGWLITESYHNFFASAAHSLASNLPSVNVNPLSFIPNNAQKTFFVFPIYDGELLAIVMKMKKGKGSGFDEINCDLLNEDLSCFCETFDSYNQLFFFASAISSPNLKLL